MLSFRISRGDARSLEDIADRALSLARRAKIDIRKIDIVMDLTATHANGCRMNFAELAAADQFNLSHDVFGIMRHLNRETGQLEDFFVPRFSQRKES